MAVVADLFKINVAAKLNNGTKEDGKLQTLSVQVGGGLTIDVDNYEDQKAMNIVNLMRPVLSKEVYEVQKTANSTLSGSSVTAIN